MDWSAIVGWVRERQGLRQAAFAHLLDVDQATVSRWECGKQVPNPLIRKQLTEMISQMGLHHDGALPDQCLGDRQETPSKGISETLLATIEEAKASAEQLTARLASETVRAGDLAVQLLAAEQIAVEIVANGEPPPADAMNIGSPNEKAAGG